MERRPPRSRFAPRLEGLETRVVLSTASLRAPRAAAPAAVEPAAPTPDVTQFPLRMVRFTGLFQGSYMIGPSRAEGFTTQLYMKGGGNTSAFLHGDVQLAMHTPADRSFPTVGQANVIPKSASDSGDQLLLDFQSVPGAVDRGGRPTEFTWTVSSDSGGQFSGGEGSGTITLAYFPGRKIPRGATGAGRLGVTIRGNIGINQINGLIW